MQDFEALAEAFFESSDIGLAGPHLKAQYYATFEDDPGAFANKPWYRDALMFLDWNKRAVSQSFTPVNFEDLAEVVEDMVEVGLISGRPDDSKVIPTI